jgi:hypothetical protein
VKAPESQAAGKRGRREAAAIAALLTESTLDQAARAAGISAATLFRWLKEDAFRARYAEARRDAFGQAIARLQQASSAAVDALLAIAGDAEAPAAARVSAASRILEHATKAIELEDVTKRLNELEQALATLREEPRR